MSKKSLGSIIIISIVFLITGFIIGFFAGEKVYIWKIMPPFVNTDGQFDLLLVWTAATAIGTLALACVTVLQNNRANAVNKRLLKLEEVQYMPIVDISIESRQNEVSMSFENIGKSDIKYAKIISDCIEDDKKYIYDLKLGERTPKRLRYSFVIDTRNGREEKNPRHNTESTAIINTTSQFMEIEIENVYGMKYIENVNFKIESCHYKLGDKYSGDIFHEMVEKLLNVEILGIK